MLYAFNVITNHYNVGSGQSDFYNKRVKVILINLNWFSTTKLANQALPKEENILLYPESIHKEGNFLLKIININLDFIRSFVIDREVYFSAGKDEGIINAKSEMIRNMYQRGISLEIICECANLSIEEVKNIITNQTDDTKIN